jgi:hypothetical protein
MIKVYPIRTDVRVVFEQNPVLPPKDIQTQVEDIWSSELLQGDIFNGSLFSVVRHGYDVIVGREVEYKYFLAQRRAPKLFDALMIQPLAVSGLLVCRDGVVFGRRSSEVEQDRNLWELIPAGSIDGSRRKPDGSIDLSGHLLKELAEETGIESADIVLEARPFALVEDQDSRVFDVGLLLNTNLTQGQIHDRFDELRNREYTALQVIELDRLRAFAQDAEFGLSRVSAMLLETIGFDPAMGAQSCFSWRPQ